MANRKPGFFTRRVFNPIAMRFGIGGTQVLAVRGRSSGAPRRVPVIPVEVGGARYLVSPRGETDWVRNLRAAQGAGELGPAGALAPFTGVEVPVVERAPILEAYETLAGRAVTAHFRALPDPADHPVFRIDPR
jgi:hypothetical protein